MTTRTTLSLAIAALVALATTACNREEPAQSEVVPTPAVEPAAPATPPADANAGANAQVTQAEALTLLNVINQHEINAAEQAKSKNVTGPALEYANMMQADHSKNMAETKALMDTMGGAPAESQMAQQLRVTGETHLTQLGALEGEAYAKAYIDAMVRDHQDTVNRLDTMLIPAATDDAVRQHLTRTREAVQMHLTRAQELQGQMGGAVGGTGQGGTQG